MAEELMRWEDDGGPVRETPHPVVVREETETLTPSERAECCCFDIGVAAAYVDEVAPDIARHIEEAEAALRRRIGELETELEAARKEQAWVRKKVGLTPETPLFTGGGTTLAGTLHVLCANAHGMTAYIQAYKCDDKEGEIGRLAARVAHLETAIRQHRGERGDDRCYQDDGRLYVVLPEGDTRPARETAVTEELNDARAELAGARERFEEMAAGRAAENHRLRQELAAARARCEGLAERVAEQGELLSRNAEKATRQLPPLLLEAIRAVVDSFDEACDVCDWDQIGVSTHLALLRPILEDKP